MATVTIQEFQSTPNSQGEPIYGPTGADVVTVVTTPTTHTIAATTRYAMVTCDSDVRAMVGSASVGVGSVPVLSAITNDFYFDVGATKSLKLL